MSCSTCKELQRDVMNLKHMMSENFDAIFVRFDTQDAKLLEMTAEFREMFAQIHAKQIIREHYANINNFTQPDRHQPSAVAVIQPKNELTPIIIPRPPPDHDDLHDENNSLFTNYNAQNDVYSGITVEDDASSTTPPVVQPCLDESPEDDENFFEKMSVKEDALVEKTDAMPLRTFMRNLQQPIHPDPLMIRSKIRHVLGIFAKDDPRGKCSYCPMRFTTYGALKNHSRRVHRVKSSRPRQYVSHKHNGKSEMFVALTNDDPRGKCPYCSKQFQYMYALKRHLQETRCRQWNEMPSTSRSVINEDDEGDDDDDDDDNNIPSTSKELPGRVDKKILPSRSILKRKYVCQRRTKSEMFMKLDANDPRGKCEVCSKQFSCIYGLQRHMRETACLKKNIKGTENDRMSATLETDTVLQKTPAVELPSLNDTSSTICPVCAKNFSSYHVMKRHVATVHHPDVVKIRRASGSGTDPRSKCHYCFKQFSCVSALNKHLRYNCRKRREKQVVVSRSAPAEDPRCKCPFCSKQFSSVSVLNRHLRENCRKKTDEEDPTADSGFIMLE